MVNNIIQLEHEIFKELPHREVNWCSVLLSEVIASGGRLEASVYNPKARYARDIISSCKWGSVPLYGSGGFITCAYYGGRLKRRYVPQASTKAVGFIGSSEMLDIKPTPINFMNCDAPNIKTLKVNEGTILISRSGTIGNIVMVNKTLSQLLISEHAIRLECPNYAGYVYAFLKSHIGQTLISSQVYGAVIQEIEPHHLSKISIPNPPNNIKTKINDLIIRSYELRDKSNDLLDKATAMLVAELNLPPLNEFHTDKINPASNVNAFSIKLSELSGRLDSSYHIPIVRAITKHLRSYAAQVTTVGSECISKKILLPGRFKRVYVEKGQGRVFFSGKSIMELDPYDKKYLSFFKHDKRIREQLTIHHNMLLVTCSGTVGKVAFVPKHWDNWAMTHDIIRIVPTSNMAGYVFVWLKTDYARTLIEATAYGSVVPHIEISHISEVPVPLLKNPDIQIEVNRLALEANELRFQSYKSEKEAIDILEKEVLSQ